MEIILSLDNKKWRANLLQPIDIGIVLKSSEDSPRAWYQDPARVEPVQMGKTVGKVSEGASVNFNNIFFNPHAHGTHTESYGHISEDFYPVNKALKSFFFIAELISIVPENRGEDLVITDSLIATELKDKNSEAVIIRTMPNDDSKKSKLWSKTNWPYLTEEAALLLRERGVNHLLIDLPSVDREYDEGKLLAHKAFWNYPQNPRPLATITEMIFVPNEIPDGTYLLNLQMAAMENDASPSRPVLYKLKAF